MSFMEISDIPVLQTWASEHKRPWARQSDPKQSKATGTNAGCLAPAACDGPRPKDLTF